MSSTNMDRVAGVRYFERGAQHQRGIPMGRPHAIVLSSVLATVACATTVPIDLSELLAVTDGGHVDAGFAGFGSGNAGFGSEFGGFPMAAGGSPFLTSMGGAIPSAGGRSPGTRRGTGGATTSPTPTPTTTSKPPVATGGRSGTGAGGATSNGGATTGVGGAQCRDGEKVCGGVCVSPGPRTGCGLTGCDPCSGAAPTNGVVICNGSHECDVSCLSGYTKNGNTCEAPPPPPPTTGPATGSQCGGQSCPSCTVILGPACCTSAGKCGCPLIPWTGGILGCL